MLSKRKLKKGFDKYLKREANLLGVEYQVTCPNYSVIDNTPTVSRQKVKYKISTGAKKYLNIGIIRVPVFEVIGARNLLKEGTVLIKGTFTSPSVSYPTSTVLTIEDIDAAVALRTTRRCHIALSQSDDTDAYTYLYQNVLYDIYTEGYQTGALSQDFARGGTPIATSRFVMYVRSGLITANYAGLTVIETDNLGNPNGHKWTVEQSDWSGSLMVLSVRRAF